MSAQPNGPNIALAARALEDPGQIDEVESDYRRGPSGWAESPRTQLRLPTPSVRASF